MKAILTLSILLNAFFATAQSSGNPSPSVLSIDSAMSTADVFNNAVIKNALEYRFVNTDKSTANEWIYLYSGNGDNSLRIKYRFEKENGKLIVKYQSVTADLSVIMPIVNGLFHTNLPADIDNASTITGPITYKGKEYQCMLQADEFRAGYWVLSFMK